MARHRAPAQSSRALATAAVTGAAVGASLLTPATALAATGDDSGSQQAGDTGPTAHEHPARHTSHAQHRHLRPMTSGEQQYRNGCRQGYITEDCQLFSVRDLLQRGINPFL